ncbi:MAG: hypothetical protein ABIL01_25365 [Pseudomonadota bacterium]
MELAEKDLLLLKIVQGEVKCKKCDIRGLISQGANPALVNPITRVQPIHFAAKLGNIPILKGLLEDDRVYADAVDARGKVPYEWADDFQQAKAELLLVTTILDNPTRYSSRSVREARMHFENKSELA